MSEYFYNNYYWYEKDLVENVIYIICYPSLLPQGEFKLIYNEWINECSFRFCHLPFCQNSIFYTIKSVKIVLWSWATKEWF